MSLVWLDDIDSAVENSAQKDSVSLNDGSCAKVAGTGMQLQDEHEMSSSDKVIPIAQTEVIRENKASDNMKQFAKKLGITPLQAMNALGRIKKTIKAIQKVDVSGIKDVSELEETLAREVPFAKQLFAKIPLAQIVETAELWGTEISNV